MLVGLITMGTLAGLLAGVTTLLAGHSVWMALALYAGGGTAVTLVVAGALALPCPRAAFGRTDRAGARRAKKVEMLPGVPKESTS